jgi:transketolase
VPGALLAADRDREAGLRSAAEAAQLNGLPGHPDVSTPFIAANTGSLGMGISKAYGMARANRYTGRSGRIVVMTGDGELQEGPDLGVAAAGGQRAARRHHVIVDHNKFQSDTAVPRSATLGRSKRSSGSSVGKCARRRPRLRVLRDALAHFRDRHRTSRRCSSPTPSRARACRSWKGSRAAIRPYHFHAGAPSLENYVKATRELIARVNATLDAGAASGELTSGTPAGRISPKHPEKIVLAYGDELLEMARHRPRSS